MSLVSIVVPTRNGISTLPALAEAIARQDDRSPRELVVVDSGSSDGTLELARQVADTVITVVAEEFDHGETRNRGIAASRGEVVILIVQDARPIGPDWLSRLLAPLRDDPRVAGAFARQVPRGDAPAVVRQQLAGWVASGGTSRVVSIDPAAFAGISPPERLTMCAFDNVCAAVRRAVWQQIPFRRSPIAEDLEWGRDVLLAGHRIAFAADAVVEHSHDRSAWYELRRTWVLHQQLYRLFGFRAIPTVGALAQSIAGTLADHHRASAANGDLAGSRAWRHAMRLGVAWPVGQFAGGWTAARGRDGWRPGGV